MPNSHAGTKKMNIIDQKILLSSAMIFFCLVLSILFPSDSGLQSATRSLFFLIILPVLYIKLILKEDLSEWGWNSKNHKKGYFWSFFSLLAASTLFYFLINFAGFAAHYSISPTVSDSFGMYLLYELVFFNFFFLTQIIFFQGFVLFAFRKFSAWSITIQFAIYFLLLLFSNSLSWAVLPYLFISLCGGLITYKTRSFLYSYIFGFLFIIILDAYIIHLVK